MDEGATPHVSSFGKALAHPSMNQSMKFDNALHKLEIGQKQLLTKVDLQLERLDEILKLQEQVHQQPAELAVNPMAFFTTSMAPNPTSATSTAADEPNTTAPDATTTLPCAMEFLLDEEEEEKEKEREDLKAYQCAMG
eukprot:CAMPEP_0172827212 /NCGR_PEP_ID=MMETSP1075-20121228/19959_1 /TAXON_ID=2916 /ORGANISM="Ceratium fusus, Strain PA161109" /LENGTH=137 /DNA_ID=CAMNT_0013668991 /DNA_START=38 /DNA_END=447 /DNA_ORIENTATION=-